MPSHDDPAVLWNLRGHGRDVRCLRQKTRTGLELRVLWGDELFLTETFREEEPLLTRADEFRTTLQARGWAPLPTDAAPAPPAGPPPPDVVAGPESLGDRIDPAPHMVLRTPGQRPRVLIVDDEPSVRSFLKAYLEEGDYAVLEAGDVDSALTALDDSPMDAVVLDIRMPDPMGWGRTGLEVLAFIRLHGAFASLPVLILTGQPLTGEERDLVRRHRAHLFQKPDGYRLLLQRLDELTDRSRGGRH